MDHPIIGESRTATAQLPSAMSRRSISTVKSDAAAGRTRLHGEKRWRGNRAHVAAGLGDHE